jgi:hypothetical protein
MTSIFNRTKQEMDGLFSAEEACLICDALNGLMYTEAISARQTLITEIINAIVFQKLDEKWQVDAEGLLEKLEQLYEIHAFVIIVLANEFWEDETDDYIPSVKKLFGIN